jgi:hypothetical protein
MIKTILPLLAFSAACSAAELSLPALADSPPQSVCDFLYAIRQVESGDRYDGPPGPAGELGAYQFRRQVWAQHTEAPFSQARTSLADTIAARHYQWIAETLRSSGVADTVWNCAAAWNCGLENVCTGRIPRSTRDYAQRVQNLMNDKIELRQSLTPHFHITADLNALAVQN